MALGHSVSMKQIKQTLALIALSCIFIQVGHSHCQVPCGIYADAVVFGELETDVATIAKAMDQINILQQDAGTGANQLVRWIDNKEKHAQNIQDVMGNYFLAQRIKLDLADQNPEKYQHMLRLAHESIVFAMKCKQTTDH